MNDVAIATISWARNEREEAVLRTSLQQLSECGLPVYITDGGSSGSFLDFLRSLNQFNLYQAKGLWQQAKNSITAAGRGGAKTILYTEPDKLDFFKDHLPLLLDTRKEWEAAGLLLASRSATAFATFPAFQQMTETAINRCCKEVIGKEMDYCYGPFLFPSSLIPYLDQLPAACGWGWRPFLFALAHRSGLPVDAYVSEFVCPADQRIDDGEERIYRMKQLTQNIEGLLLATTVQPV